MSAEEIRTAIRAALDDPRVTTDSLVTVAHADQLADQLAAAMADTIGQELRHLRRWKNEALPVIDGLQELGRALDIPLGHSITGPEAAEAARKLRDTLDRKNRDIEQLRIGLGGVQEDKRRAIANLTKERNDARDQNQSDARELARLREEVRRARVAAAQTRLAQGVTEK